MWHRTATRPRLRHQHRARSARRPGLEALETRALLSTFDTVDIGQILGDHDHGHDLFQGKGHPEAKSGTEFHVVGKERYEFVWEFAPAEAVAAGDPVSPSTFGGLHPLSSVPALNSNPGASASLYLDFDGHFESVWGAYSNVSNPAYDMDGDESTFSDRELANIEDIWRAVSEDFSPFNINVTTVEPAVLAPGVPIANANKVALRVAIGGTPAILGLGAGYAGYAYISAFTNSIANVAYVMPASMTTRDAPTSMASFVSHEAGHAFGLQHQSVYDDNGVQTLEYNPGDRQTWAPTMGTIYYSSQTTIWYNGPNRLGPTNLQDDMAVISGATNGFGYRADDHGNTTAAATFLPASGPTWAGSGRIGTNTDVDVFRFTVGVEDTYRVAVTGDPVASNLDAVIELRNASGTLLATGDPADSRGARVVKNLTPGNYYVTVKKVSAYGWLGQYTVDIDAPPAGITVTPSSFLMSTAEDGRPATFTVALDTMPLSPVTIPVSSTNPAEGTVSTSSLVFNSSNWDTPQTVTITGVADGVADNDSPFAVVLGAASSADPDYAARDAADLTITNIDTDATGSIYRVDTLNDAIVRSTLSGSQAATLIDLKAAFGAGTNFNPRVIALDPIESQIFWIDATTATIYRANLDGSNATVAVTLGAGGYGLALDPVGRKLYWPENNVGIRRANLDGSGAETIFSLGTNGFRSLAVDPVGGKLYFTDTTADVIRRANLDGTGDEILYTSAALALNGHIALDVAAGKMYWTDPGMSLILRANLDGSGVETLVDLAAVPRFGTGSSGAVSFGLALDIPAGKMYWNDFVAKALYRANLDGSNMVLLSSDIGYPDGLLIVPPTPGFRVSPRSGLVTTESGGTATFSVSLATPPTANVTIPVSSSDASEGTASTTLLTFTPANWNIPQVVTVTGVNDSLYDLDVPYTIVLGAAVSADPAYDGRDPADVSVTNTDDDPAPTKFFIVNDGSPDRTYEYGPTGAAVENYGLNSGNTAPRGAASTAAGDKVWVVDANRKVYVYDTAGVLLGSWSAGSLASNATVQGIATNGTDVWIIDARSDRVFRYTNAAGRLSGSQNAASSFKLNSGNTGPKGIVTDGTYLWALNDSSTDKVFKYTLSGSLLGSWTVTGAGSSPTGITLDPTGGGELWVVDSGTDRVYQFDNARSRTSGSQSPSTSFALAAGNTNPQGIADPPAGVASRSSAQPVTPDVRDRALEELGRGRRARFARRAPSILQPVTGREMLAEPFRATFQGRRRSRPFAGR